MIWNCWRNWGRQGSRWTRMSKRPTFWIGGRAIKSFWGRINWSRWRARSWRWGSSRMKWRSRSALWRRRRRSTGSKLRRRMPSISTLWRRLSWRTIWFLSSRRKTSRRRTSSRSSRNCTSRWGARRTSIASRWPRRRMK